MIDSEIDVVFLPNWPQQLNLGASCECESKHVCSQLMDGGDAVDSENRQTSTLLCQGALARTCPGQYLKLLKK